MKQYKITPYYLLALLVLIMSACSKMDDYKAKYMQGGSITYPGVMDSVKILSGKNRVIVTGLFTSDPKIVKYRVFWNSKQDSIEVPVKRTAGVDSVKLSIPNLAEGTISFEIRTYDINNHISIPIRLGANVYGALYASGIVNRGIVKSEFQKDNSATVTWADVSSDAGVVAMQIKYTNILGVAKDTLVKSASRFFVCSLPKFKAGNKFSYRTAYLPIATAIDTFYTAYQDQAVVADITSLYLKNYKQPFTALASTNRFRTPTDWTVTAPVFNHSGIGGWGSDDGTVLCIESGWGAPSVLNGKMYQTVTLPAGNYAFTITLGNNGNYGTVYLVAALGNTLPDVGNVPTQALAYTTLGNKTFKFSLTQTTQISLGFVVNMTGDGYWRVKEVNLSSL
jgi:hypothetical protein